MLQHTKKKIREFIRFSRLHEWHPGKLPILIGFGLTLSLAAPMPHHGMVWIFMAYMLTSIFLAASYMFNNCADFEQDSMVKKKIGLENWSLGSKLACAALFALLGIGIGFIVLPLLACVAMICCYGLAWMYSFPPRLKEHVFLGPFIAAFAQLPAPALIMALAWGALPASAVFYLINAFLYGLRMILVHQLLDFDNDIATSTRTTAISCGRSTTGMLISVIFWLELLGTAAFLLQLTNAGMPALFLAALGWPACIAMFRVYRGEPFRLDSYSYIPLADVHESVIPIMLALCAAVCEDSSMISAVLLLVILFYNRHFERLILPLLPPEAENA